MERALDKQQIGPNRKLSSDLDIFATGESSHQATNSPSLITSSPTDYNFQDKARAPPPGKDATNLRGVCAGGICIFYKNHLRVSSKDTVFFTTFKHFSSYFTFKDLHLLVFVIYHPCSMAITLGSLLRRILISTRYAVRIHLPSPDIGGH